MLRPLVRRTWAPTGERPVLRCWDRRDRLSVMAGLTMSACQHHLALHWAVYQQNIRTAQVEDFIRQVQRKLGRPLVVVMASAPPNEAPTAAVTAAISSSAWKV